MGIQWRRADVAGLGRCQRFLVLFLFIFVLTSSSVRRVGTRWLLLWPDGQQLTVSPVIVLFARVMPVVAVAVIGFVLLLIIAGA